MTAPDDSTVAELRSEQLCGGRATQGRGVGIRRLVGGDAAG